MKRNAAGGQQVRDFEGVLWDVRDIRNTKYGFDLLFGRPVPRQGKYNGPTHLIATRQLVALWEANRTNHNGVIMDLPAGRGANDPETNAPPAGISLFQGLVAVLA